ncbi:glycosyltransferase [Candidatus Peregrinibacteria bacterium]|nr:glycosyltransferase [Candidatus Peregrinibacteria bacterium]
MKIGIDASRYLSEESTGVEWYSYFIINGLLKLFKHSDNELVLYSRYPIKIKETDNIKNNVLRSKRFWSLLRLSKEMREKPPDTLFVPSHVLPLSLPQKSVIVIHDTAFKHFRKVYSTAEYRYLNWSTKRAVSSSTKIITPSKSTKKDLLELYNCDESKIEVIYHGFTPPKFSEKEIDEINHSSDMIKFFSINKPIPYFFFVGRLESKKNIENTIRAFKQFSEQHPNYKFVLAGKRGNGIKRIVKAIHELKLTDKVIMPGYITEKEKAYLYKNCKAFIFPSFYEGFGLPILEAFYFGKPVLTSNVSSLPEVGGDACLYVNPTNVESIAERMSVLAEDEKKVQELTEKGKMRLDKFNWEETSRKTFDLLMNA